MEIVAGSVIRFLYPASNYPNARPRLERRLLRVEAVRDLDQQPLDPLTLQLDPHLCRQGQLVTGYDLDRLGERSFYSGSMQQVQHCPDDEHHSVIWFEADDWRPGSRERLPDEIRIVGTYVEGICGTVAHLIADGGNAFLKKSGERHRWLAAVDWNIPQDLRESA